MVASHRFLKAGLRNASQMEVLLAETLMEVPPFAGVASSFNGPSRWGSPSLCARAGIEDHGGTGFGSVGQPGNGRGLAPMHDVVRGFQGGIDPTVPPFSAGARWQLEFERFPIGIQDEVEYQWLVPGLNCQGDTERVVAPVGLVQAHA